MPIYMKWAEPPTIPAEVCTFLGESVETISTPCQLPPLSEEMFYAEIQTKALLLAGGIDGLRAQELRLLPR